MTNPTPKMMTPFGTEALPTFTEAQLKQQAAAFLAQRNAENRQLTKEQLQKIAQEAGRAEYEMFEELTVSDSDELRFLRSYLIGLGATAWSPAERLDFMNNLIQWAYDVDGKPLNAAAHREKTAKEISEKEAELERLKAELDSMKKSLDKELK